MVTLRLSLEYTKNIQIGLFCFDIGLKTGTGRPCLVKCKFFCIKWVDSLIVEKISFMVAKKDGIKF
jgi:hypothetical protein